MTEEHRDDVVLRIGDEVYYRYGPRVIKRIEADTNYIWKGYEFDEEEGFDEEHPNAILWSERSQFLIELDDGEVINGRDIKTPYGNDALNDIHFPGMSGRPEAQELCIGEAVQIRGYDKPFFIRYIPPHPEDSPTKDPYIDDKDYISPCAREKDITDDYYTVAGGFLDRNGNLDEVEIPGDNVKGRWPGARLKQNEFALYHPPDGGMIKVKVQSFSLKDSILEDLEITMDNYPQPEDIPWDMVVRHFYEAQINPAGRIAHSRTTEGPLGSMPGSVYDLKGEWVPAERLFPDNNDDPPDRAPPIVPKIPPAPPIVPPIVRKKIAPPILDEEEPLVPEEEIPIPIPEEDEPFIAPPIVGEVIPEKIEEEEEEEIEIPVPEDDIPVPEEDIPVPEDDIPVPEEYETPRRQRRKKKEKKLEKEALQMLYNPPTTEYMLGDWIRWRDEITDKEYEGTIVKLWWGGPSGPEEYPSVVSKDIGKMLVEVSNATAPPGPGEALTEIVQGQNVTAWLDRTVEGVRADDDDIPTPYDDEGKQIGDWVVEKYEGPKLMIGDLVHVPGHTQPTIIKYLANSDSYLEALSGEGWGESLPSTPLTTEGMDDAIVYVYNKDLRASDVTPISGNMVRVGDLVEWVKDPGFFDRMFGNRPANFAEIKKIIFPGAPDVTVYRAPWQFKTHYQFLVQIGPDEKVVEGVTLYPLTEEGIPEVAIETDVLRVGDKVDFLPGEEGEFKQESGVITAIDIREQVIVSSLDSDNVSYILKSVSEVSWGQLPDLVLTIQVEDQDDPDIVQGKYVLGPTIRITPDDESWNEYQEDRIAPPYVEGEDDISLFGALMQGFAGGYKPKEGKPSRKDDPEEGESIVGELDPTVEIISYCEKCGKSIPPNAIVCPICKASQSPPDPLENPGGEE